MKLIDTLFHRNANNVDDEIEDEIEDDEDENENDAKDEVLSAIEKLTEMFEKFDTRLLELEMAVSRFKGDDIKELKAEIDHRSRYMETIFEHLLDKDFTKSGAGDRYTRMYRNGKIAGPIGKLPG